MTEPCAWRYRVRRPIGTLYRDWQYTDDAEKIERLRSACDDDGGRLTNERIATWVIEPLVLGRVDRAPSLSGIGDVPGAGAPDEERSVLGRVEEERLTPDDAKALLSFLEVAESGEGRLGVALGEVAAQRIRAALSASQPIEAIRLTPQEAEALLRRNRRNEPGQKKLRESAKAKLRALSASAVDEGGEDEH